MPKTEIDGADVKDTGLKPADLENNFDGYSIGMSAKYIGPEGNRKTVDDIDRIEDYAADFTITATSTGEWVEKLKLSRDFPKSALMEITFSCLYACSDNQTLLNVRAQMDDDPQRIIKTGDTIINLGNPTDERHLFSGNAVVQFSAGSHFIDLDYRTGEVGKTMYACNATITIRELKA
jgi:hypothetical protein